MPDVIEVNVTTGDVEERPFASAERAQRDKDLNKDDQERQEQEAAEQERQQKEAELDALLTKADPTPADAMRAIKLQREIGE